MPSGLQVLRSSHDDLTDLAGPLAASTLPAAALLPPIRARSSAPFIVDFSSMSALATGSAEPEILDRRIPSTTRPAAALRPPTHSRTYASSDPLDDELDLNVNTSWLHRKRVWFLYIALVFAFRTALEIFDFPPGAAWTAVNFGHAGVTFLIFHWMKGNPFDDFMGAQGKFARHTFWEQIEEGLAFTSTKKFLTLVPIGLFFITAFTVENDGFLLFLNFVVSLILVVAKMPRMHGVRILGVNKD